MTTFYAIGYWYSESEPHFCNPQSLIDEAWNEDEKQRVVTHIRQAEEMMYYRGYSACRLCNKPNGVSDKSDGLFYFPEGLDHYLETHSVKPPQLFIDFALGLDIRRQLQEQAEVSRQSYSTPSPYLQNFEQYLVDFSWWIEVTKSSI